MLFSWFVAVGRVIVKVLSFLAFGIIIFYPDPSFSCVLRVLSISVIFFFQLGGLPLDSRCCFYTLNLVILSFIIF